MIGPEQESQQQGWSQEAESAVVSFANGSSSDIQRMAEEITGDTDAAMDICQDTILIGLMVYDKAKARRLSQGKEFKLDMYLYTVARRLAIREARKLHTRQKMQISWEDQEAIEMQLDRAYPIGLSGASVDTPEEIILDKEDKRLVMDAYARLSVRKQQVLNTTIMNPKSYDEIVRETGIPIGSLGPTRARGIDSLKSAWTSITADPTEPTIRRRGARRLTPRNW